MPLLFIAAVLGTLGTILSVYKLIHNIFLGQLRLEHRDIQEVPWSMRAPMLILVGIAFLFGWMPGLALDLVALAQHSLGIAMPAYHLGGVELPNGQLNMLWVVGVLLGGMGFGAILFYLVGGRTQTVHQYDNYAGGHFLTADIRYQYSHNFYPGLMRVIGPLYRGSVAWLERAITNGVGLLSAAMHGLYQAAEGPHYLLWSLVAGLLVILVG